MVIQWYPGHMAKARRELLALLPDVDMVVELADARVPMASRNPDLIELIGDKLHLLVLNKADLAMPPVTKKWVKEYRRQGIIAVAFSVPSDHRRKLLDSIRKKAESTGRRRGGDLKVLVAGVPNVGKSALINKLAGRKSAAVGALPGVTRGKQWIRAGSRLMVLDTPGILWPKFEEPEVGYKLAAVGAIRERVLPLEDVALWLGERLHENLPLKLETTFNYDSTGTDDLLLAIAKRRALYIRHGEPDLERAAALLLREFQLGKFGRISLETPLEKGE